LIKQCSCFFRDLARRLNVVWIVRPIKQYAYANTFVELGDYEIAFQLTAKINSRASRLNDVTQGDVTHVFEAVGVPRANTYSARPSVGDAIRAQANNVATLVVQR
jgi:hypothetical protein